MKLTNQEQEALEVLLQELGLGSHTISVLISLIKRLLTP